MALLVFKCTNKLIVFVSLHMKYNTIKETMTFNVKHNVFTEARDSIIDKLLKNVLEILIRTF